ATLSKPSQRILSAPVLNRRFKTSAQPIQPRKDGVMQNGSLSREQRKRSSDVWCYRWWESGPTGRRIHRRIILGTVEQLYDKRAANQATVGLRTFKRWIVTSPFFMSTSGRRKSHTSLARIPCRYASR